VGEGVWVGFGVDVGRGVGVRVGVREGEGVVNICIISDWLNTTGVGAGVTPVPIKIAAAIGITDFPKKLKTRFIMSTIKRLYTILT
jgi:hypothetical protein